MAFLRLDLPDDAPRAATLEELGYFINEHDKIAAIDKPEFGYQFTENKNERYNQLKHEDYEEIGRVIIEERLAEKGILKGFMPCNLQVNPTMQSTGEPQVPVFFSKFCNTPQQCDRLLVLVGKNNEAPHVHSRHLWDEQGVNAGSIVNFVDDAHYREKMGIIIANPGQLVWSRTLKKAMTPKSFDCLPRHKGTDEGFSESGTKIPENESPVAHLESLFKDVVLPIVKANETKPKVYIIAVHGSGRDVVEFLQGSWDEYKELVQALVICAGDITAPDFCLEDFYKFWHERGKMYSVDIKPLETPIEGPALLPNVFSAGVNSYYENVFNATYKSAMDFFDIVHNNPKFRLKEYTGEHQPNEHGDDGNADDSAGGIGGWDADDSELVDKVAEKDGASKDSM